MSVKSKIESLVKDIVNNRFTEVTPGQHYNELVEHYPDEDGDKPDEFYELMEDITELRELVNDKLISFNQPTHHYDDLMRSKTVKVGCVSTNKYGPDNYAIGPIDESWVMYFS